jgi:hypothetical protein
VYLGGELSRVKVAGTSGRTRNQLYASLVYAGINVTWPENYVDGPELTDLMKRTKVCAWLVTLTQGFPVQGSCVFCLVKILLVMRAFSNDREFKMSRLMIAFSPRWCVSSA